MRRAGAARGARVELWIAGDPLDAFVQECAQRFGVPVLVQRGPDLGARMSHALAEAFSGLDRSAACVLIGSDCPAQTPDDLEQAAAALRTHDAVLQPALDGGYVLVGVTRPQPGLFEGIEWGSERVAQQTLRRSAELGLRTNLLRPLPDLDAPADLQSALEAGWIELRSRQPSSAASEQDFAPHNGRR